MPFLVLADTKRPTPGERPRFPGNNGQALLNFNAGKLDMKFSARRGIADGVAAMLILLFVGSGALAQAAPKTNEVPKSSALNNINSGDLTTPALAIAYNNRGDAYVAKGSYDLALQDFEQSIKNNPTYAKPFN